MKQRLVPVLLVVQASVATACGAKAPIAGESGGTGGNGGLRGSMSSNCDIQLAQQTVQALGLTVEGPPSTLEETVPAELTGPDWGLIAVLCAEGGYDLSRFAGSATCSVMQEITRVCQGLPAEAWVIMREGVVGCVYITLRPGSGLAPGAYSVADPNCHD